MEEANFVETLIFSVQSEDKCNYDQISKAVIFDYYYKKLIYS